MSLKFYSNLKAKYFFRVLPQVQINYSSYFEVTNCHKNCVFNYNCKKKLSILGNINYF